MVQDSGSGLPAKSGFTYSGGQPRAGAETAVQPKPQHAAAAATTGISIQGRQNISITGVIEVIGFADNYVSMSTQMGLLHIIGSGLHILKLVTQSGEMTVEGRVDALEYSDPDTSVQEKKRGLLSKLWK